MKAFKSVILAAAISLPSFGTAAQSLSPAEVADRILLESPAFKTDLAGIDALSASLKTESNLPDPEIEGEYLFAPEGETNRWGAGISWGFDWPGLYSAKKKEAAAKLSAAEAAMLQARHERLIEIKRLLLDYVLVERQLAVLGEIAAANDSIRELSEKAEKYGELTRLDMNKLKLEQASLESGRLALMESKEKTLASLNALYGKDATPILMQMECGFPEIVVPDSIGNLSVAPSVATAEAETEAARKGIGTASAEALPGFSIGYQHAFEEGIHFNGATLGVSIPLFSSRGKRKAAIAALAEAEMKAENARLNVKAAIDGSLRSIGILKSQIEAMTPVVGNPDNTDLLMKAYKGGIITLIDYLNERNYFTNATLDLLTLRHAAANLLLDIETHISGRQ